MAHLLLQEEVARGQHLLFLHQFVLFMQQLLNLGHQLLPSALKLLQSDSISPKLQCLFLDNILTSHLFLVLPCERCQGLTPLSVPASHCAAFLGCHLLRGMLLMLLCCLLSPLFLVRAYQVEPLLQAPFHAHHHF